MDHSIRRWDSNPYHSISDVLRIGSQSFVRNGIIFGAKLERESPYGIRDVRLRATLSLDR